MRIPKDQIPAKIDVPGAVARQTLGFGDATGYGKMAGEYFTLGAGTDIAPLLKGLKDDGCHAPHWGYMLPGGSSSRSPAAGPRPASNTTSSTGRRATPCAS